MAFPSIIYDAGGGPITLQFSFPPVSKAGADGDGADEYNAIRDDSFSESGLVQSVVHRVDNYRTLQMDYVPDADVLVWAEFVRFARYGYTFAYYPDSASSTHYTCTLADTNWSPKFNFRGIKKFTLKLRLAASGQDAGGIIGTGPAAVTPLSLLVTSPDPLDPSGDYSVAHGLSASPVLAVPVPTSEGLTRLQAAGWDGTNIYLNSSAPGLTAVVFIFP